MEMQDVRLLGQAGWTLDCESPFEISKEGSRATGEAAWVVLKSLREAESASNLEGSK